MRNIFLLLIIFFFYFSCKQSTERIIFSQKSITTPENGIVHITIPVAKEENAVSEKINSKVGSAISQTITIGDRDKKVPPLKVQIDSFNLQYQKFKTDFPYSPMVWEAQIDGEILYQSAEIITVALTNYTNTGGAHGITTISFLNFETSTGKSIENNALFKDEKAFKKLAKSYFSKEINNNETDFWNLDDFQLPANIGFSEDGIVLLYNVYEIAPYSSGITEFNIPFEEVEYYLNYH